MDILWRHIPEHIDPILFSFGAVSVWWYAVFFVCGAFFSLLFFLRIARRDKRLQLSTEDIFDLSIFLLLGAFVGARLGYAVLYNFSFFVSHPLALVSPFDPETGAWIGIAGMSAHGGLIGMLLALLVFSRKRKKSFWMLTDKVAFALPIAIFFGRMGNFVSGELFGRITDVSWGMVFLRSGDELFRHPSQLYEAFGEGIILFFFLLILSKKNMPPGKLFAWALGLYGGIRFCLEFFREPDQQLGFFFGMFTLGQLLSIGMILTAVGIGGWIRSERHAILPRTS